MSKLRQDWVDQFQAQEGISLIYRTVTFTTSTTTGSTTSVATADSVAFIAIFEAVSETDALVKVGDLNVGDSIAFIPKSLNAKELDRIVIVSTSAVWEIRSVDQRKTHDFLTLTEYTRA